MQSKFNPALLRTQNLLKMWQSVNGMIDQRTPKGFKSVLLSLGNVVHSDNDEESLYACCCTQKMTIKGCNSYSILAVTVQDIFTKFNQVNLQLHGNGVNLLKPNQQSSPSCPSLMLFKRNRALHEL